MCETAVFIATDILFSLLPITFIRHLRRPLRERVAIALLMALALVASAAGIVKTYLIKDWAHPTDPLYYSADPGLWGFIEMYLGIIAVCAPCLKGICESGLKRLGWMGSERNGSGLTRSSSGGDEEGSGSLANLEKAEQRQGLCGEKEVDRRITKEVAFDFYSTREEHGSQWHEDV